MAINFPDSPSNGDTHVVGNVTYVYNNAKSKWDGAGQTPNDRLTEGSNSLEIDANNDLKWIGDQVVVGDFTPLDARNGGGIHIRHSNGISFKSNSGQSVSRNWRIRNDDWGWGNLDFGVGDNVSDWSDAADDNVLSLASTRRVGIKQSAPNSLLSIGTGNAVGDATNPAIQIGDGGNGTYRLGFYTTTEGGIIDAANGDDGLIIHTKNVGEALRVTSNGELSLGTTTPPGDFTGRLYSSVSYAHIANCFVGRVPGSSNNNQEYVLLHKLGAGQGFHFAGDIIVNSYTGCALINCHITSRYTDDNIAQTIHHSSDPGITKANIFLTTVTYDGDTWLTLRHNGGGTGVFYINGFFSTNANNSGNGGIKAVVPSAITSPTDIVQLNP